MIIVHYIQGGRSCPKARRALAKKFALAYAILRFVVIYELNRNLWAKKFFLGSKAAFLGQ